MRLLTKARSKLQATTLFLWAMAMMLVAIPAMADQPNGTQIAAMGAGFLVMFLVIITMYVYFALALQTIAKKTNTENDWWAWVPILQGVLMLNIAKKPVWWIVLLIVPLVGLVFGILAWMSIAEARNKPSWWGILLIVPVFGLVVPGYLAWAD
jgi:hypothetical protein